MSFGPRSTILVTGANGLVGSRVVARLARGQNPVLITFELASDRPADRTPPHGTSERVANLTASATIDVCRVRVAAGASLLTGRWQGRRATIGEIERTV